MAEKEPDQERSIKERLMALDSWVDRNGYAGYDLYDLLSQDAFRIFQKNRYTTFALKMFLDMFPFTFRRLFRVQKAINPKAMALFAEGYLNLYRISGDERYVEKAVYCLDWLMENPSEGYSGYCWGYPFDWQSRIFIPKHTPSSVVTSICAHAFMEAFSILGDRRYMDVAKSCCNFMINDLKIDHVDSGGLCFSYTPLDTFHVHNANIFSASILYRVGDEVNNDEYIKIAEDAVRYTLSAQNPDGSWYYFGHPETARGAIDNYHTGFILRNLLGVYKITGDGTVLKGIRKGLGFYTDNLLKDNVVPKFHRDIVYPIDIHACSESILCLSILSEIDPDAIKIAEDVAVWTIDNMQSGDGYFYYRKYHLFTSKIPYIRWGQAWMLYALSELVKRLQR